MPADDLVLNVRQVASYPPVASAPSASFLLLQTAGLGSSYASISPQVLVSTALATGGDMTIGGALAVRSLQGGSTQFSNAAVGLFAAQKASIQELCANFGWLNGVPIATADDVAALAASTVSSFNGRVGNVSLWIDDIICAGGAPLYSPRFTGSPRAETPPPTSNSTRLATTEWVTCTIGSLTLEFAPLDSPNFTGVPTAPTATAGSSDGQLATTAFVMAAVADSVTGVVSFNSRTGVVVLTAADITGVGGALLASPIFTGVPQAPTAAPVTNTNQIATTAFVAAAVAAATAGVSSFNGRTGAVTLIVNDVASVAVSSFNGRIGAVNLIGNDVSAAGGALVNSPVFTGVPSGPTAAVGTNTTQLATTAFVAAALVDTGGVVSFNGRAGIVTLTPADITGAGGATLASPAFSGTPTAPTATAGTNNTQLATTAFVAAAIAAGVAGVASFNGRTGVVSLITNDLSAVGGALLASPAFTGVPIAPTATAGTNTTQLATTAFVTAAIAALAIPAASTTTPLMNGTAAVGSGATWARSDHVHPSDTSRLALTGGTLTGTLNGTVGNFSGQVFAGVNSSVSAVGAGNSQFILNNNAGSSVGLFQWLASGNEVVVQNLTGGGNVVLQSNVTAAPGGGGNFIVSPGLGFQAGGGAWTALSDERIKTVDGDYEDGLEAILALRPVVYRYKGNEALGRGQRSMSAWAAGKQFVGLVAQEAERVMPRMITAQTGFIDGKPVDDLRALNASAVTYALINAVKALAARVAALEGGSR